MGIIYQKLLNNKSPHKISCPVIFEKNSDLKLYRFHYGEWL